MKLEGRRLSELASALRERAELDLKRDIQRMARALGTVSRSSWVPGGEEVYNGDDAAALLAPDGSYVLLAAEGMQQEFVASDPWFAGFCSVMVNVADIAAMGGVPWAVVDVLFAGSGDTDRVVDGMKAASEAFGVPIVGGHTSRTRGDTSLAVAIVGRANHLLDSRRAEPGQALLAAVDLRGTFRGPTAFNAATSASPEALRKQFAALPALAAEAMVTACKDISNAGLCGTLLMLLEACGCGAVLDVNCIPAPPATAPLRWLTAFPSFGFLMTTDPAHARAVCERFERLGVCCRVVGEITGGSSLELTYGGERTVLADLKDAPLTGFGADAPAPSEVRKCPK